MEIGIRKEETAKWKQDSQSRKEERGIRKWEDGNSKWERGIRNLELGIRKKTMNQKLGLRFRKTWDIIEAAERGLMPGKVMLKPNRIKTRLGVISYWLLVLEKWCSKFYLTI